MTDLPLTKMSETATTVTIGWEPVACVGYVLYVDGERKSNSWDPLKKTWKVSKAKVIQVFALGYVADGVYPSGTPKLVRAEWSKL